MTFVEKHECSLPHENRRATDEFENSFRRYFLVNPDSRLANLTLKSQTAIDTEVLHHVTNFPATIHPFSKARKYWEYFMIGTFVMFFVCMPYHSSFVFNSWARVCSFTAIVEIVTVDIVINFFTGVHDPQTEVNELSLKIVAKKYLMTYFLIDLITSFPNNFLFLLTTEDQVEMITVYNCYGYGFKYYDGCLLDVLDILKYLKILRFPTFLLYIDNTFKRNAFRTFHLKVTLLVVTVAFSFHFLACAEFLVERLLHGHDSTSESRLDYWGEKLDMWNTTTTHELYLHTIYRTFYLLSNFSFVIPTHATRSSEIISTFFVLLGYVICIYLISHAYMLMQIIYSPSMKFQQNRCQLQEFMRYKQVPNKIQQRLLNHYDYKLQKQSYNESNIHKIVGNKLFEDISFATHSQILKCVNFIRILPLDLIKKLSVTLTSETFLTNNIIRRPGQGNNAMHIITFGTVAMFNSNGDEIRHFEDNEFFGGFFESETDYFIVALETTETYSLTKDNFMRVMNEAPSRYYERAKLVATNGIDLNGLFEDLIDIVVSGSKKEFFTKSESVVEVVRARSRHVSMFHHDP